METPNETELCESFRDLDDDGANLILQLAYAVDDQETLETLIEENCLDTWQYANSCYSWPFNSALWRRTMVLHAIDRLVGTCGVEAMNGDSDDSGARFEYLNAGDTYAETLIFDRENDRLFLGCIGDILENSF